MLRRGVGVGGGVAVGVTFGVGVGVTLGVGVTVGVGVGVGVGVPLALKRIYFVISYQSRFFLEQPCRCSIGACRSFVVRSTAVEDDGAGVAIVAVQLTIAFHASYPNNRIVGSVSRGDPRRPSPALIDVPSESNSRRTCRINYVRPNFAASV